MGKFLLLLFTTLLCSVCGDAQVTPSNPFPTPSFDRLGYNPTPCYVVGQPVTRHLDATQICAAMHAAFRAEDLLPDTNYVWTEEAYQMRLSGYDTAAAVGYLAFERGMKGNYERYSPEYRPKRLDLAPFSSAWISRELDGVKTEVEGREGPDALRLAVIEALRARPEAIPPYLTLLNRMAAYEPYDRELFQKLVIHTRLLPQADAVMSDLLHHALEADTDHRLDAVRALGDQGWTAGARDRSPLLYEIAQQIAREAPRDTLRWAELDELRREMTRPGTDPITPAQLRCYRDGDRSWWNERRAARTAALAALERAENVDKLTRAELEYLRTAFPYPAVLILQSGDPYTRILTPAGWTMKEAEQQAQLELTKAVRRWIRYVRQQRVAMEK